MTEHDRVQLMDATEAELVAQLPPALLKELKTLKAAAADAAKDLALLGSAAEAHRAERPRGVGEQLRNWLLSKMELEFGLSDAGEDAAAAEARYQDALQEARDQLMRAFAERARQADAEQLAVEAEAQRMVDASIARRAAIHAVGGRFELWEPS